ncbi:MAG TPA: cytochrome c1 [Allosphingosinicella sp.]|nr:cytochrome c1 [Allosphingosinicella sp.]
MVRILGILVGLGFVGVAAWSLLWGVIAYIGEPPQRSVEAQFHEHPKHPHFEFEGPFGRFSHNQQQLQRGLQVYREVCASCHGLQYVAFRNFEALGYSEGQVRTIANEWTHKVPSINPRDGAPAERNPLPADRIPNPYPNEAAARNANNNALPPDLSLITKARHGGAAYVYSLLTGYQNPPANLPAENRPGEGLHYNPYFPNLNIAMPAPLSANQVTYADGTPATVDQMAQDVSAFLAWAAEPESDARKNVGLATLIFLLIATIIAYMAYQNVWAGRKH